MPRIRPELGFPTTPEGGSPGSGRAVGLSGVCLQIKSTVIGVELPLIRAELEAIDVQLLRAESTLFWNGDGRRWPALPVWVLLPA